MMLFFVGIIEMLIATLWTKMIINTKVAASGFVTMINILIWFYVLQTIVEDISNWHLALLYALGCAIGTSGSTYFFQIIEKRGKKMPRVLATDKNPND